MLDYHEWTIDDPPPENEWLLFAELSRCTSNKHPWIVGVGLYSQEFEGIIGGDQRLSGNPGYSGSPSMYWARFNVPAL